MLLLPPSLLEQILNLVSTIFNLLTLLISLILLCLILYQLITHTNSLNRKKLFKEIPLFLSINTLCLLFIRSLLQFFDIDLNTIKRNYFSVRELNDSFSCHLRGYFLLSIHNTLYWSYTSQAVFRFIRIIFPKYTWLYQTNIYLYIFIPIQFLLGFLIILPILIGFNAIYLIPNEPYCTASFTELGSVIYMSIVVFMLPLSLSSMCYLCILWKVRQITTARSQLYQQRNRRDFILIRRIVFILTGLGVVSVPISIDLLIHLPKGYMDPHINSIGWVSSSINAVILAISLPFINPKMYELLKKPNRIHIQRQMNC